MAKPKRHSFACDISGLPIGLHVVVSSFLVKISDNLSVCDYLLQSRSDFLVDFEMGNGLK